MRFEPLGDVVFLFSILKSSRSLIKGAQRVMRLMKVRSGLYDAFKNFYGACCISLTAFLESLQIIVNNFCGITRIQQFLAIRLDSIFSSHHKVHRRAAIPSKIWDLAQVLVSLKPHDD